MRMGRYVVEHDKDRIGPAVFQFPGIGQDLIKAEQVFLGEFDLHICHIIGKPDHILVISYGGVVVDGHIHDEFAFNDFLHA